VRRIGFLWAGFPGWEQPGDLSQSLPCTYITVHINRELAGEKTAHKMKLVLVRRESGRIGNFWRVGCLL
jgi:hypothetical protein